MCSEAPVRMVTEEGEQPAQARVVCGRLLVGCNPGEEMVRLIFYSTSVPFLPPSFLHSQRSHSAVEGPGGVPLNRFVSLLVVIFSEHAGSHVVDPRSDNNRILFAFASGRHRGTVSSSP